MLWIAASVPFSLWVMKTIIEDNREQREEADRKVKEQRDAASRAHPG